MRRLVYVSSVHAIPEKDGLQVLREVASFFARRGGGRLCQDQGGGHPDGAGRRGGRAWTPWWCIPPASWGPTTPRATIWCSWSVDYMRGQAARLRAAAATISWMCGTWRPGCLAAADKGRTGECYILSNRHYEVKDVLRIAKTVQRRAEAAGAAHVDGPGRCAACWSGWPSAGRERPLYTEYSLYTLASNDRFSHDKATRELGYQPRDLYQTIRDTIAWLNRKRPAPAG